MRVVGQLGVGEVTRNDRWSTVRWRRPGSSSQLWAAACSLAGAVDLEARLVPRSRRAAARRGAATPWRRRNGRLASCRGRARLATGSGRHAVRVEAARTRPRRSRQHPLNIRAAVLHPGLPVSVARGRCRWCGRRRPSCPPSRTPRHHGPLVRRSWTARVVGACRRSEGEQAQFGLRLLDRAEVHTRDDDDGQRPGLAREAVPSRRRPGRRRPPWTTPRSPGRPLAVVRRPRLSV